MFFGKWGTKSDTDFLKSGKNNVALGNKVCVCMYMFAHLCSHACAVFSSVYHLLKRINPAHYFVREEHAKHLPSLLPLSVYIRKLRQWIHIQNTA